MYYIVYPLLWLVSLLPLRVLYLFSELFYGLAYYVFKYRKAVVLSNLRIAFPEKTDKERQKIAKKFYRNFIDTFIEAIKLLSKNAKWIRRHSSCEIDQINQYIDKGSNIHIMAGHQFNWEFGNLIYALDIRTPFVGVYMPISNKVLDRIFFNLRNRYGTILVSAPDFKNKRQDFFAEQYILALAADQSPGHPANAYWMNFMGKLAPFVTGPAKGAVKNNTAVFMITFKKIKRGYYHFSAHLIAEEGINYTPEQLTLIYKKELEKVIRLDPSNYLWSHRKWKHEYKPEYGPVIE